MKRNTKFKVGDLIIYPCQEITDCETDYGIVVDVAFYDDDEDYYYHIHWSLDQVVTIEDWDFAEENFLLVSRP